MQFVAASPPQVTSVRAAHRLRPGRRRPACPSGDAPRSAGRHPRRLTYRRWRMLPPGLATSWSGSSPRWEDRLLRVVTGRPLLAVAPGELEHLRQVQGAAVGAMGDLLLAAEPVGDDQRVLGRFADGGQQHPLAGLHRDLVALTPLVAEGAGQAAAA